MIRAILIDIDNTIYSKRTGLQAAIFDNMKLFIKNFLYIESDVDNLIKRLYRLHGNIFSGLIRDFNIDPEEFINFVFDINVSDYLVKDLSLKKTLKNISIPIYAFSNSPSEHVEKVITNLGIADCFSGLFDRRFFNYKSKADCEVYLDVLNNLGIHSWECVLIDDNILNINIAKNLGFYTVLFSEDDPNNLDEKDCKINNILDVSKIPLFNKMLT